VAGGAVLATATAFNVVQMLGSMCDSNRSTCCNFHYRRQVGRNRLPDRVLGRDLVGVHRLKRHACQLAGIGHTPAGYEGLNYLQYQDNPGNNNRLKLARQPTSRDVLGYDEYAKLLHTFRKPPLDFIMLPGVADRLEAVDHDVCTARVELGRQRATNRGGTHEHTQPQLGQFRLIHFEGRPRAVVASLSLFPIHAHTHLCSRTWHAHAHTQVSPAIDSAFRDNTTNVGLGTVTTRQFDRTTTTKTVSVQTELTNHHYNRPYTCFRPDAAGTCRFGEGMRARYRRIHACAGQYAVDLVLSDGCAASRASASISAQCNAPPSGNGRPYPHL
jgi:hypothetical protein